jgi:hypothetical protein
VSPKPIIPQDWGIKEVEKRCRIPPAEGLGVPPSPNFPQDWGTQGVEKWFINILSFKGCIAACLLIQSLIKVFSIIM